jgi:ribosomal protein S18 acetylase RimI-like enzyme
MGPGDPERAVRQAREIAADYNATHGLSGAFRIEYVSDELLPALARNANVAPMSGDYVYATSRLIDLAGGDLASKRQDRNRFERRFAPRTEALQPQHIPACLSLMDQWALQHVDEASDVSAIAIKRRREQQATTEALQHADALGLVGMVVYSGEKLVGFTLGETLGRDSCSILIEKADREYKGSAQYIYNEFCRQYWAHTPWTNAGDDWDVPSLAWTKESYRPAHRLAKWMVFPKAPAPVAFNAVRLGGGIARGELQDLADIGALEDRTFEPSLTLRPRLRYLLRCPRASFHLLRVEGQLLASAAVLRRRTKRGLLGRLYSLAADDACRGKGHGRAVLKDAVETLAREGVTACVLEVEATNHPAIRLYESEGFAITAELRDYYGPGRHAWKMRRELARNTCSIA